MILYSTGGVRIGFFILLPGKIRFLFYMGVGSDIMDFLFYRGAQTHYFDISG